jgi:hypothetical protein
MEEPAEKDTGQLRNGSEKRKSNESIMQRFQIPDALSTASDSQVASGIESRSAGLDPAPEVSVLRRPAWLAKSIWPFQTSALEVEGCRIAFTDVGRGPVVLFVHTGFWSFIWRDVILRFSGDFRCVCFDAPGAGQSDRLPVGRISLDRASRVLTALIERLDLRDIILVAHDLGGPSGIAGAPLSQTEFALYASSMHLPGSLRVRLLAAC